MEERKKKSKSEEYNFNSKRLMNQLKAHLAGKHTMITVPNPDPTQTNKKFIKVSGKEYFKLSGE